jgi:hypothetical protein
LGAPLGIVGLELGLAVAIGLDDGEADWAETKPTLTTNDRTNVIMAKIAIFISKIFSPPF